MEVPAEQSTGPVVQLPPGVTRRTRHRRPSGEPRLLPRHLQTSGVGWLVAALVLVAVAVAVFSRGLRGLAVEVTVVDDAVVRWLAGADVPGLRAVFRGLAALSSWWSLYGLLWGLVLALLVLRRFRHLIIWLVLAALLELIVADILGAIGRRPRPFGVVIETGWGGWALPSLQITLLTAGLVSILYTLVPEGRWRNTGKWVVTGLVALVGVSRVALGADAPTDVLVGVAVGVTLPLLAFRWFTPSQVFPIGYRRGRSAHLDVGGPAARPSDAGWRTSWG
jgi:membrane-associated phospholipid phosphatase